MAVYKDYVEPPLENKYDAILDGYLVKVELELYCFYIVEVTKSPSAANGFYNFRRALQLGY
jgi:hypothetical protein